MITIIAQNKNMALAIARATGNDDEGKRYFYGDKYFISWTIGKMVEITTPRGQASYWFRNGSFPHIPKYFTLSLNSGSNPDGTPMVYEAAAQVDAIRGLLKQSDSIVVATAPTQRGELIFRYLYSHLGCDLPFSRAIINDLTNKTILRAITQPQSAEKYDNWYRAARLQDEADWLIGVNARRAIAFAAGRGTYQVGRTSTSVLKLIQQRNEEVSSFQRVKRFHTTIAVKDANDEVFSMQSIDECDTTPKRESEVQILDCTSEEVKIHQPKLYNLISLQIDAAEKFGMSPQATYEATLRLYDRKLISYPAVASTSVSYRRYTACRGVLEKMLRFKNFASVALAGADFTSGRSVAKENLGTQGIIVTPVPAFNLDNDMSRVYYLILRRMYQAFSKDAVIIKSSMTALCEGVVYEWKGVAYKNRGWHALFPETILRTSPIPAFLKGDTPSIFSTGSFTRQSESLKPFNDATLIKELIGIRGIVHSVGIAKDITHLAASGLTEKDAWGNIFLTDRGRALYGIVKDMKIADINSVKETDELLHDLLKGRISASAYDKKLKQITRDITAEILASSKLFPRMEEDIPCPACQTGLLKTFGRVAKCDNPDCGHYLFRQFYGVTLNHTELKDLAVNGATSLINGFRAMSGKTFKGRVIINAAGNPQVISKTKSSTI
ncbi:MAG: DNA topoisomerase [Muribaculum sp.]|nr:DNA topoisomerase [Muribaculum sp.]